MDLSTISDQNGYIRIAALDHRSSLRKILPENEIPQFKSLCTETFAPYISAVLLDPEYGINGIEIAKESKLGILLCRESSGYTENNGVRTTRLYQNYYSDQLQVMGANAIKLLVYYNSDAFNTLELKKIVDQVSKEVHRINLPLFLEIVTYPIEGFLYHKGDAILRAIQDLRQYSDILKLEFPIDVESQEIENAVPYLDQMTSASEQPWVLLSRGMKFDLYKKALQTAKDEGCKGFAVGRAVWQEIANYSTWEEKENFIKTTALERINMLSQIFS